MKKFMDWFNSYDLYYVRGAHLVVILAIFAALIGIAYLVAYQHGWTDSYQLFDKLRPHRPITG